MPSGDSIKRFAVSLGVDGNAPGELVYWLQILLAKAGEMIDTTPDGGDWTAPGRRAHGLRAALDNFVCSFDAQCTLLREERDQLDTRLAELIAVSDNDCDRIEERLERIE